MFREGAEGVTACIDATANAPNVIVDVAILSMLAEIHKMFARRIPPYTKRARSSWR